jgi:argininosuccinate synthase
MPAELNSSPIVLAYSGGLDTSFLVPWLKDNYGRPIITVTVDTGGIDAAGAKTLAERSRAYGAIAHHQIDARADYFEQVLRFLIMGNVRRGQLYPLCVGAERVMQAQTIALMARKLGTNSIAHGCTAAGNDQVRFEVALRTLAPELEVIAPVRDRAFKRQEELDYLQARNLPVPPYGAAYSINRGLWGVTIGGKETLTSEGSIPDSAWVLSKDAFTKPRAPEKHTLHFEKGRPTGGGGGGGVGGAFISVTPSSARKAGWHSRPLPPKSCSRRIASSRNSCSRRVSSASRNRWRVPTATGSTKASCSIPCAATSKPCWFPRRSE